MFRPTETGRPEGCYFDIYGAEEELLRTLTCDNCPLSPLNCQYKARTFFGDCVRVVSEE